MIMAMLIDIQKLEMGTWSEGRKGHKIWDHEWISVFLRKWESDTVIISKTKSDLGVFRRHHPLKTLCFSGSISSLNDSEVQLGYRNCTEYRQENVSFPPTYPIFSADSLDSWSRATRRDSVPHLSQSRIKVCRSVWNPNRVTTVRRLPVKYTQLTGHGTRQQVIDGFE